MQNTSTVSPFSGNEKISRVLQFALQTPSSENCQPWKFVVHRNIVEVFHLSERAKLSTFSDNFSVFGLGMVAESLNLACSTEGLQARITYFLEKRSDKSPWLRVELSPADTLPDPLARGIFLRHTDRRRYAGGSLQDSVFKEAHNVAEAISGANLYFTCNYPEEYLQLLRNADQLVMTWPELRHDIMKWTRFTDKEAAETRDGMGWRSYLRGPENWVYYLRSRIWWLATRLNWFPAWLQRFETLFFDDSAELSPLTYDDGAGIGCVTTASDAPKDLVSSGRLAMRLWLLFNLSGYGFQPITNLSGMIYRLRTGAFILPVSLRHFVANGYEILQGLFGFPLQELPMFTFRTGLATGEYPDNSRQLRRTDHICYTNGDHEHL
uniref:Nitroreductase family protein n=1 Tax=Candidatus Kentrum sp. LFY TaxID=2126342 RepID=A0A450UU86_9GAMM|nr:MAG: hypothetical protein BECKLFY1418A_GA0070994_10565 [Candidatus Kentron sp. LFY]